MGERFSHTSAKRIYVSLILTISSIVLFSCASVNHVVNRHDIIAFGIDKKPLHDKQTIYVEDDRTTLYFIFTNQHPSDASPSVYSYGDGIFALDYDHYNRSDEWIGGRLNSNVTYQGLCRIKYSGQMIILFIWERKGKTSYKSLLINVVKKNKV